MVGLRLEVPVGNDFAPVAITEKTQAIRLSLGTRDPAEADTRGDAKVRLAVVVAA